VQHDPPAFALDRFVQHEDVGGASSFLAPHLVGRRLVGEFHLLGWGGDCLVMFAEVLLYVIYYLGNRDTQK